MVKERQQTTEQQSGCYAPWHKKGGYGHGNSGYRSHCAENSPADARFTQLAEQTRPFNVSSFMH
jgi:hypothetical protein